MFDIDIVMVMGVTDIDDKIIKRAKEVKSLHFSLVTQNTGKCLYLYLRMQNVKWT